MKKKGARYIYFFSRLLSYYHAGLEMGHGYNAPSGVFSLSFSELDVIVSIIMHLNR